MFRGQCAEYCGGQHALMALFVVTQSRDDFDAWLARQAQPASVPTDAFLKSRLRRILQRRLSLVSHDSRHASDGDRRTRSHACRRPQIARAGVLNNHIGTMAGWIAGAQDVKPGNNDALDAAVHGSRVACAVRLVGKSRMNVEPRALIRMTVRSWNAALLSATHAAERIAATAGRARTVAESVGATDAAGVRSRRSTTPQSGLWYIGAALLFLVLGGILALIMRTAARCARERSRRSRFVQPAVHDARLGDDVLVRRARRRSDRHSAVARDARRARSAVSATVRLCVLGVLRRRSGVLHDDILRSRARRRLVHVSAADELRISRLDCAPTSGCSASASSRSPRLPARSKSSWAFCARGRRA